MGLVVWVLMDCVEVVGSVVVAAGGAASATVLDLKWIFNELITFPLGMRSQYTIFLINPSKMHLMPLLFSFFC
jgi:hypothetical protein